MIFDEEEANERAVKVVQGSWSSDFFYLDKKSINITSISEYQHYIVNGEEEESGVKVVKDSWGDDTIWYQVSV